MSALITTGAKQMHWLTGTNTGMGDIPSAYYSDVWSIRIGRDRSGPTASFSQVTAAAPWGRRDDGTAEIADNGVMAVVAGWNNYTAQNDVWVSADGGYVWNMCVKDAEWSDRRYQTSLVDKDGYIWVRTTNSTTASAAAAAAAAVSQLIALLLHSHLLLFSCSALPQVMGGQSSSQLLLNDSQHTLH